MSAFRLKILCNLIIFCFINGKVFAQSSIQKYIFIGHCYQPFTAGNQVDYRLVEFDFSTFDGVWLGGDVCSETTLEYSTVQSINTLFNLSNLDTHWSLGNHDARNGNLEWYEQLTGRRTYYAYSNNWITPDYYEYKPGSNKLS